MKPSPSSCPLIEEFKRQFAFGDYVSKNQRRCKILHRIDEVAKNSLWNIDIPRHRLKLLAEIKPAYDLFAAYLDECLPQTKLVGRHGTCEATLEWHGLHNYMVLNGVNKNSIRRYIAADRFDRQIFRAARLSGEFIYFSKHPYRIDESLYEPSKAPRYSLHLYRKASSPSSMECMDAAVPTDSMNADTPTKTTITPAKSASVHMLDPAQMANVAENAENITADTPTESINKITKNDDMPRQQNAIEQPTPTEISISDPAKTKTEASAEPAGGPLMGATATDEPPMETTTIDKPRMQTTATNWPITRGPLAGATATDGPVTYGPLFDTQPLLNTQPPFDTQQPQKYYTHDPLAALIKDQMFFGDYASDPVQEKLRALERIDMVAQALKAPIDEPHDRLALAERLKPIYDQFQAYLHSERPDVFEVQRNGVIPASLEWHGLHLFLMESGFSTENVARYIQEDMRDRKTFEYKRLSGQYIYYSKCPIKLDKVRFPMSVKRYNFKPH
jgi:hypothetical protein